jgi:hypothetical protein
MLFSASSTHGILFSKVLLSMVGVVRPNTIVSGFLEQVQSLCEGQEAAIFTGAV